MPTHAWFSLNFVVDPPHLQIPAIGDAHINEAVPEEWTDAVHTVLAMTKRSNAGGRGRVAHECMQVAVPRLVRVLARCMQQLAHTAPPMEWRGGLLWR